LLIHPRHQSPATSTPRAGPAAAAVLARHAGPFYQPTSRPRRILRASRGKGKRAVEEILGHGRSLCIHLVAASERPELAPREILRARLQKLLIALAIVPIGLLVARLIQRFKTGGTSPTEWNASR
jgi:hypothetical protein